MQKFYNKYARGREGDLNSVCLLSEEARSDLEWRVANLSDLHGMYFSLRAPDLEIYSDASLSGWGAECYKVTKRGPWIEGETGRHINELELLGAFYALKSFVEKSEGLSIRLFLDNTTAITYINKRCETKSSALSDIAKDLILL